MPTTTVEVPAPGRQVFAYGAHLPVANFRAHQLLRESRYADHPDISLRACYVAGALDGLIGRARERSEYVADRLLDAYGDGWAAGRQDAAESAALSVVPTALAMEA